MDRSGLSKRAVYHYVQRQRRIVRSHSQFSRSGENRRPLDRLFLRHPNLGYHRPYFLRIFQQDLYPLILEALQQAEVEGV